MKKSSLFLVLLASSCASNSGVISIGRDTFFLSRRGATGLSSIDVIKTESFQEASLYCSTNRKNLKILSAMQTNPPYIMGNFPKVELQFMCLNEGDPELKRRTTIINTYESPVYYQSNEQTGQALQNFSNQMNQQEPQKKKINCTSYTAPNGIVTTNCDER